jgi:hypothetical protein
MWYLTNIPQASDLRTTFGYKPEFSGVGAFLLRHKGQWRINSIYNLGLEGLTVEAAVNNLSKSLFYFQIDIIFSYK